MIGPTTPYSEYHRPSLERSGLELDLHWWWDGGKECANVKVTRGNDHDFKELLTTRLYFPIVQHSHTSRERFSERRDGIISTCTPTCSLQAQRAVTKHQSDQGMKFLFKTEATSLIAKYRAQTPADGFSKLFSLAASMLRLRCSTVTRIGMQHPRL